MGCHTSKQSGRPENRLEELSKCTTLSSEVRWSWLRAHTLFTFSELRALLKTYQSATSDQAAIDCSSPTTAPLSTTREVRAASPMLSGRNVSGLIKEHVRTAMGMDKAQFLTVCELDEGVRISVGAFGSRLFDVLDEDGDGRLSFEHFALGLSKLLKGPKGERLKLMYAAYDLSGVAPSETRSRSMGSSKSCRSKYLTVEDIAAVLAHASQDAYPTLLQYNNGGTSDTFSSNGSRCGASTCASNSSPGPEEGGASARVSTKTRRRDSRDASIEEDADKSGRSPEAMAELLRQLARKNAASYAARIVSEFGQVQDGALTPKEFEKWALTGPNLRCRINEFSIDVDAAPFQGVRLN